jgi:hypothetical protein
MDGDKIGTRCKLNSSEKTIHIEVLRECTARGVWINGEILLRHDPLEPLTPGRAKIVRVASDRRIRKVSDTIVLIHGFISTTQRPTCAGKNMECVEPIANSLRS